MTTLPTITGTSYFPNRWAAESYYSVQEFDPAAAVSSKLSAGEIFIGRPEIKENERLILLDGGLRYGVKTF